MYHHVNRFNTLDPLDCLPLPLAAHSKQSLRSAKRKRRKQRGFGKRSSLTTVPSAAQRRTSRIPP